MAKPIAFRSNLKAAFNVVPEPQNGSKMVSSLRLNILINRSTNSVGKGAG